MYVCVFVSNISNVLKNYLKKIKTFLEIIYILTYILQIKYFIYKNLFLYMLLSNYYYNIFKKFYVLNLIYDVCINTIHTYNIICMLFICSEIVNDLSRISYH